MTVAVVELYNSTVVSNANKQNIIYEYQYRRYISPSIDEHAVMNGQSCTAAIGP